MAGRRKEKKRLSLADADSRLPAVVPAARCRRFYATEAGEYLRRRVALAIGARLTVCAEARDLVVIGGGVAGYVAAIKAGQEGLKVRRDPG